MLEGAIVRLEAALDALFSAGRYREFFQRAHELRTVFKGAYLDQQERSLLWERLNRLTEAAKNRQALEFAQRDAANLSRWRGQLTRAEGYASALQIEIAELAARRGPPAELRRWQGRIAEKETRLTSVRATASGLRRKIADVSHRLGERAAGS